MLKITYLSHSAFLLDDGKYKLIIDPFLSGNPVATTLANEIKCDYIVVSHAHGDHIGDAVTIAKNNNALGIAVFELANLLSGMGVQTHGMHIGGSHNFPFGSIKFTIAHHGSSTPDGKYAGLAAGILITMGGKTVYHCGDTGLFLDMKLIGEMNEIDLMLAPIGDNFTMDAIDAAKAVEFVKPKLAVPMHYNTFPLIQADPNVFKTRVEALGIDCKIMSVGETVELS